MQVVGGKSNALRATGSELSKALLELQDLPEDLPKGAKRVAVICPDLPSLQPSTSGHGRQALCAALDPIVTDDQVARIGVKELEGQP